MIGPRISVRLGAASIAGIAALGLLVVYIATMELSGPWDPWETHYGEVARRMIYRHDPMDLWWQPGNDGPDAKDELLFRSKPALPFWAMSVSMRIFGVGVSGDIAEMTRPWWPVLGLRMPSLLLGLGTAVFLAYTLARLGRPRAGVIAAFALATMPQWAMISRQALTDIYFVGPVSVACCAWALAWLQPPRALRRRTFRGRSIPWDRAYAGFWLVALVGAIAPLAWVHEHVMDPYTIRRVAGFAKRPNIPNLRTLDTIAWHLSVYWVLLLGVFIASWRWTERRQCWMAILYVLAGVSLVGKGMIGPGVIGAFALAQIAVTGRWDRLRGCGLLSGTVLFVIAGFPWHHAMVIYRGEAWVNELIVVNNLARFSSGEQDQAVGGFAYYLRTLGIAAFPWVALLPAMAIGMLRLGIPGNGRRGQPGEGGPHGRADGELDVWAWTFFVVALATITFSVTKYYHYLTPVLPPLAILVGLWLDREWREPSAIRIRVAGAATAALILGLVLREAIAEPAWIAHLTTYLYTGMWRKGAPEPWPLLACAGVFAVGLMLWLRGLGRPAAVAVVLAGWMTGAYVIGDYVPAASESWSQRSMLRTYYEGRGPNDRVVSWWFYFRGETFFTRSDIIVLKKRDREKLRELIEEAEERGGDLWFTTTVHHVGRLKNDLPTRYRDRLEEVYDSFHYSMRRLRILPPKGEG